MTASDWQVAEGEAGLRLDKFVAAAGRLGSRSRAADALAGGKVFLNEVETGLRDAARLLATGDRVRVWMDRPGSARRKRPRRDDTLEILYEDAAIIAVNKPAGLLTVPLPDRDRAPSALTLLAASLKQRGARPPLVVHRIDRDTSGLVLFARTPPAQEDLKAQFRLRKPERVYWAVVHGRPVPPEGTWRDHLTWDGETRRQKETDEDDPRAAEAISHYRVLDRLQGASLVEVHLVTGKRNQIRIQAALHGHPLVGERQYLHGSGRHQTIPFKRQALHAQRLNILHPVTGEFVHLECAPPADLAELITRLR